MSRFETWEPLNERGASDSGYRSRTACEADADYSRSGIRGINFQKHLDNQKVFLYNESGIRRKPVPLGSPHRAATSRVMNTVAVGFPPMIQ